MCMDYRPNSADMLLKLMHNFILADNRRKTPVDKKPDFFLEEYGNNEITVVPLDITSVTEKSLFLNV